MVAYLTVLENEQVDTAFLRIVTPPKRGHRGNFHRKAAQLCPGAGHVSHRRYGICRGIYRQRRLRKILRVHPGLPGYPGDVGRKEPWANRWKWCSTLRYREMLLLQDSTEAETKIENIEELDQFGLYL